MCYNIFILFIIVVHLIVVKMFDKCLFINRINTKICGQKMLIFGFFV